LASDTTEKVKMRRVQRLGTSSLVVTLPKEWVRRVGLKPGDAVLVVIEGSSVRIIPSGAGEEVYRRLEVEADKIGDIGVSRLISCAYVSHVDVVRIRGASWETALEARSVASRLAGVDVVSGNGFIEVRMLLDDSRVSDEELMEAIVRLGVDLLGLVEKLLEGARPQLVQLAREAYNEIVKYEHLAVRRLSGLPVAEKSLAYAIAILGDVAADLWSIANMLATLAETRGVEVGDLEGIKRLVGEFRSVLQEVPRVARAGLEEVAALARRAEQLRMETMRATIDAKKPLDAAIAATLHHAARYLSVAIDTLVCNKLAGK